MQIHSQRCPLDPKGHEQSPFHRMDVSFFSLSSSASCSTWKAAPEGWGTLVNSMGCSPGGCSLSGKSAEITDTPSYVSKNAFGSCSGIFSSNPVYIHIYYNLDVFHLKYIFRRSWKSVIKCPGNKWDKVAAYGHTVCPPNATVVL